MQECSEQYWAGFWLVSQWSRDWLLFSDWSIVRWVSLVSRVHHCDTWLQSLEIFSVQLRMTSCLSRVTAQLSGLYIWSIRCKDTNLHVLSSGNKNWDIWKTFLGTDCFMNTFLCDRDNLRQYILGSNSDKHLLGLTWTRAWLVSLISPIISDRNNWILIHYSQARLVPSPHADCWSCIFSANNNNVLQYHCTSHLKPFDSI